MLRDDGLKMALVRSFDAKDGRRVLLRRIRWEDLDDMVDFINSLVEEGADIVRVEKVTREEEADWLSRRLAETEKGNLIHLVAEVDGRAVASAEVMRNRKPMNHVGILGIAIKKGYRGIGIGTEIMKTLIEESRNAGLKVLVLDTYETNKLAQALYRKMGFKDAGRIPKAVYRNGCYIDLLRMTLEL